MTVLYTKDGVKVEIQGSGNGSPPDAPRGGQHTNCGTMWYRKQGGTWLMSNARSQMQTKSVLESNTYTDAVAILTPNPVV